MKSSRKKPIPKSRFCFWKMCEFRRKQLGIPISTLALYSGISRPRLSEFLAGKNELRSGTIDRLCTALGLRVLAEMDYRFPEIVEGPMNKADGIDQQTAD